MIAEVLYNIAKDLFSIFTRISEKKLARRLRVSEYFSNLARIIEDTSAYLKKGVYPSGECENLRVHAEKMESTLGDLIGQHQAHEYAQKVLGVWQIEGLHGELQHMDPQQRGNTLSILDEAAGYFRGIAAHLRVSK